MLTCWDSTETVRSFAGEAPSRSWVLDEIRPTLEPVERTGAMARLSFSTVPLANSQLWPQNYKSAADLRTGCHPWIRGHK